MNSKESGDKHENNGSDNSRVAAVVTSETTMESKEQQAVHSSSTAATATIRPVPTPISVLPSGYAPNVAARMTGSPPTTRDISNPLLPSRSLDGNTPASSHRTSNALEETFIVPDNFALVAPFIYRSSFPKRKNFSFLKRVGIKCVL
jgi:hypothetical protein